MAVTYGDLNAVSMLGQSDWENQNALEATGNIALATLVDVGTSIYNSVTPEAYNTSTRGILQDIGADGAVSAYDNNRGAVEALSFVGGILIPGIAATKLAQGVRAGLRGTNFLSDIRHKEDLVKFGQLIENGQSGTKEYKALRNAMYARTGANAILDTAAAEFAIMGAMSAHPYMEDYWKNPVQNFGISMVIGGAIGGGITHLVARSELRNIAAGIETSATDTVRTAAQLYDTPFADTSSALTALNLAAGNLDSLAAQEGVNTLTKETAKTWSDSIKANMGEIFKASSSDAIRAVPEAELEKIRTVMMQPNMLGAERIDFFKASPKGYAEAEGGFTLNPVALFTRQSSKGKEVFVPSVFYSQEAGGFLSRENANQLANAADLHTADSIAKLGKTLSLQRVRNTFDEVQDFGRTGDIEAQYLANLQFYNKASTTDLLKAEIVRGDMPAMHGWVSAVNERLATAKATINNPAATEFERSAAINTLNDLGTARLKVFESDKVKLVNVEEVSALPTAANSLDPAMAVSPTYFDDLSKHIAGGGIKPLISNDVSFFKAQALSKEFYRYVAKETGVGLDSAGSLHNVSPRKLEELSRQFAYDNASRLMLMADDVAGGLDPSSILMLVRWIGGRQEDKELFRNAMASARTMRSGMDSTTPFHQELATVLNSSAAKAQADELAKFADAKGNIYLKRGMSQKAQGDTPVSSYTANEGVASGFGQVNTYRIHKDDVVGYLYNGEKEWLVGATTREAEEAASAAKAAGKSAPKPKSAVSSSNLSPQQATEFYLAAKGADINKAVTSGMPSEVAAVRFNTTPEMVELARADSTAFVRLSQAQGDSAAMALTGRWNSAAQMEEALSATRRTLRMGAARPKVTGDAGQLMALHHEALRGQINLTAAQKAAIEAGDSVNSERLAAKVSVIDEQYATIQKLWVERSVQASGSRLLASMQNEVIDSAEIKVLREGLGQFVNGRGGNPLYSSADFVTSRMGTVGRMITYIGDRRTNLANAEFERIATPISAQFLKLSKDEAARTEFAIFDNIRQSTAGFAKYDAELRTWVAPDPNAKVVKGQPTPMAPITQYTVTSPLVHDALLALDEASTSIFATQKGINDIKGAVAPTSIGTWIPSQYLGNKELAYVVNHDTGSIKLLAGNSPEDLKTLMRSYTVGTNETIMTRQELGQNMQARLYDRLDDVTRADTTKLKKGVGMVAPDTSSDRLADIINGLRDRVNYQATAFVENSLSDLMGKLNYMSSVNTRFMANNNPNVFQRAVNRAGQRDTAADIKDILLGRNPVHRSEFMGTVNKTTSATIQLGLNAFNAAYDLVRPVVNKAGEIVGKGPDYDQFNRLLAAQGIRDPFEAFHEAARPLLYARAKDSGYSVTPDRLINAGNAIASTLALKFMELAQPLVNMMSAPILGTSVITRSIKAAQLESADDLLKASPIAVMMDGVRRAHSSLPENQKFMRMFQEEGLFSAIISEADEVIKLSRFGTGGLVGGVEKALDSTFVKIMSKPSELAEAQLRKYTLMTGVDLGRRLYGAGASDRQIAIFARDFLKQSIGNYSTAQRPMMFQGSFGSAMGLFQTYMLTYAQSMYRHIDLKDYAGIGKTMLAQAGIFGAGSLPGFKPISDAIGTHFSDEHWDLTTGTFRALPDPLANMLIYGLPSNLAPDVHTRGDVSPRVPTSVSTMVGPSMVGQALETLFNVGKAITKTDGTAGQGFMEALATQSVSRPIARMSELAKGTATTGQGTQVAGPEEVWSWQGIMARVFSTRTLQESKTREAMHLNSYYGALDSEARKALLGRMRTAIRSDTLTADFLDEMAYQYLRVGTPQGFRMALNQAMMENENDKLIDLTTKLKDSPLMSILDDIE